MPSALETIDPAWAWQPFRPMDGREWNRSAVTHLFRRAAFGAAPHQIDDALHESPTTVVNKLIQGADGSPGFRRESDDLANTLLSTGEPRQLAAWWVYEMLHSPHPLLERLTLFWHGHFATSAAKVTDANLMLEQNRLLRRYALGDFRLLVHAICRDPAMLIYLDSATNRKAHPNENFARELMELFCLGEGHYGEADVRELARCFTGWEIKLGKFRFNRFQHDIGAKTVLSKSSTFANGESIDWVLEQPQAAQFIVAKLFRQFVCDEPVPPPQLLEPLADELREHEWQIGRVVQRILGSQIFFSSCAVGRKVRSPVDLAIGFMRSHEGSTNTHQLATELQQTGQGLFFPPNVKGWDGGRDWINSSTILGRANLISRIVNDPKTRFGGGTLESYFARLGRSSSEQSVDTLIEGLLAAPLPRSSRNKLINICSKNPNRSGGIADAISVLATFPECQLC